MKKYKNYLVSWLKEKALKAGCKGFVIGVSGGLDSAVVAQLAQETGLKILLISLPINTSESDHDDSLKIIKHINESGKVIKLTKVFDEFKSLANLDNELAIANMIPRIRMTMLYAFAQENNCLVLGTDNFAEYMTGYFTKHGDGACDLLPISQLAKSEVEDLAFELKLPEWVIAKIPTAGLWQGQEDEDELGVSYKAIDRYSKNESVSIEEKTIIESLIQKTKHKRKPIPKPKPFNNKIKL